VDEKLVDEPAFDALPADAGAEQDDVLSIGGREGCVDRGLDGFGQESDRGV
jgi:hypothetical protein